MTFAQKHMDLLQSLATFACLDLSWKPPWLWYIVGGKILDLTMAELVKVVKNKAYFKWYQAKFKRKQIAPGHHNDNVLFYVFSRDLQTALIM